VLEGSPFVVDKFTTNKTVNVSMRNFCVFF